MQITQVHIAGRLSRGPGQGVQTGRGYAGRVRTGLGYAGPVQIGRSSGASSPYGASAATVIYRLGIRAT